MYRSPLHWLQVRVRVLCVASLLIGSMLPPYQPRSVLAVDDVTVHAPQFLLVEDGFLMKPSSLTRQGARRAFAEGIIHTVRDGDSIERLSSRYGIQPDTIRWANAITGDVIRPGDELLILPVDGVLHSVRRGQTLSLIAQLYDVPEDGIAQQNHIDRRSFLLAGQELIIPGGAPIIVEKALPPISDEDVKEQQRPSVVAPPPTIIAQASPGVLQRPCNDCYVTQYFHPGHFALDLQTRGGGLVFAAEDGVVMRADMGWNAGYGNVIEIDHGNDVVSLYAHNKDHYVSVGERVRRGQVIATMGNSGRTYGQTGIHVHFEIRVKGVKKNPMLYLQ